MLNGSNRSDDYKITTQNIVVWIRDQRIAILSWQFWILLLNQIFCTMFKLLAFLWAGHSAMQNLFSLYIGLFREPTLNFLWYCGWKSTTYYIVSSNLYTILLFALIQKGGHNRKRSRKQSLKQKAFSFSRFWNFYDNDDGSLFPSSCQQLL